jgi:hypothetical protein
VSIPIAPNFTVRPSFWTAWKALLIAKSGIIQYDDNGDTYNIWFYDGVEAYTCTIWKGIMPETITPVYSQEQNDSDKADFESNYKADGNKRISRTDSFGNPIETSFEWAASLGLLPGVTAGRAGGYVGTSSTAGVAIRATSYSPQGTDARRSLKSNNANDAAAGTGARKIRVTYLNTSFELKTEVVTLNGTTAVNTVAADIAFLEKMEVTEVGTQGGGNVGTISIYTLIAGGGSVWGSIAASDNMTYWAHHYIAGGKTCHLLCIFGGATAVAGTITFNRSGNPLGTTEPQKGLGATFVHGSTNYTDHEFRIPITITGPDFVWLVERPTGATASTAHGFFEYVEF